MKGRWRIWGAALIVVLALLIPVLVLGLAFEERVQSWVTADWSPSARFGAIVAALSSDILLPVPSSGVSTYAGGTLGVVAGTVASWAGMTLGAVGGFALARWLGRPFAERFGGEDVAAIDSFAERYGAALLILTRPLPLIAEACVLVSGSSQMAFRRFLPPVLIANLVISTVYAAAGAYFQGREVLPQAVIASVILPLGVALVVRRAWQRSVSDPQRPHSQ